MRKKILKLVLIGIVCVVPIAILHQVKNSQRGKEKFKNFNEANINGKLNEVKIGYKGSVFTLINDSTEYVFYPYTNQSINKAQIFNYIARKGDSIIKPAYSDTLKLIKSDEVLKYTFKKFGQ